MHTDRIQRAPQRAKAKEPERKPAEERESAGDAIGPKDNAALPPGQDDLAMTPAIAGVLNDWVADAEPVARHSKQTGEPDPQSVSHFAQFGLSGGRTSLPYQADMERGFGRSLGDIPVYSGPRAEKASDALNADAYSYGGSIVLGNNSDKRIVAEETAHALQHRSGTLGSSGGLLDPTSGPEVEAGAAADAVIAGNQVSSLSHGLSDGAVARAKKKKKKKKPKAKVKQKQQQLKKTKQNNKAKKGSGSVAQQRLANDPRMGAGDFDKMQKTKGKQAPDLSKKEKSAHARGQAAIYDQTITKGKTVEQSGNDGAHQLSKVLPSSGDMLAGTYGFSTGGSIGHAETTAGRSAKDTKEILGLDYDTSPFLNDSKDPSKGFKDEGLTYIQFGMTKEMKEQARVSMEPGMLAHVKDMQAEAGEAMSGELNSMKMLDYGDATGGAAFKGHGGTAVSEQYGDATTTMNQELTFGKDEGRGDKSYLALPDGTKMMHRDKAGEDKLIAELVTNDEDKQEWQYNMELANEDPGLLMSNMTSELTTLNQNLQKADDAVGQLDGKVADNAKDIGTKKKKISRLEGEVTSAEAKLKDAEKGGGSTGRFQNTVSDKKQKLAAAKSALQKLEADKAELASKLQTAQDKVKESKSKLESRKPTLDDGIKKCQAKLKKKGGA